MQRDRYDAGSDDPSDAPSGADEEEQVRPLWRGIGMLNACKTYEATAVRGVGGGGRKPVPICPCVLSCAQVRAFWRGMQSEVEQVAADPAEFKNHQLPLARIKKVGVGGIRQAGRGRSECVVSGAYAGVSCVGVGRGRRRGRLRGAAARARLGARLLPGGRRRRPAPGAALDARRP